MHLPSDDFDCTACTPADRLTLGHSKPAATPVLWDAPPGFYSGKDDPRRFRCPKLDVTPWAHGVLDIFQAATEFHAPPGADSRLWPAKLAAALTFLRGEQFRFQIADGKRREAERERQTEAWKKRRRA